MAELLIRSWFEKYQCAQFCTSRVLRENWCLISRQTICITTNSKVIVTILITVIETVEGYFFSLVHSIILAPTTANCETTCKFRNNFVHGILFLDWYVNFWTGFIFHLFLKLSKKKTTLKRFYSLKNWLSIEDWCHQNRMNWLKNTIKNAMKFVAISKNTTGKYLYRHKWRNSLTIAHTNFIQINLSYRIKRNQSPFNFQITHTILITN